MVKVLNVLTGGLRREGITSTQLEYMKKMNKSNIRVDIAAVHNNAQDVIDEFECFGCRVVVFPDRKSDTLKYALSLFKEIKKEKYDVIHVHGNSSLMAIELLIAKIAGVKSRIAHSRNTKCDHVRMDKLLRPIFNHSYTLAFACGNDAGKWMFQDKPFTVIHNGKDIRKFQFSSVMRNELRSKYSLGNKLTIGFVGNIKYQKNPDFLVEVFDKLHQIRPDSVLFVIGDGEERSRIETKVKDLGIRDSVILTGRVSNVAELLKAMDIMLLPSNFEGLPNVVLEWQIAGLQSFVSTNVTEECKFTDLVEFLPIDKGPELWVDKILAVDMEMNREELSQYASNKLREANFDIEENAEHLKQIYISTAV